MAALTALQRLMKNPKTAKFVESLKHSDLPANWADDPEIVDMAGAAYKEMGESSPFFKAYEKVMGKTERMTHGTPYGGFEEFRPESYFTKNREYAERYMTPSASSTRGNYEPATSPEIYDVFVASKNPFDTRKAGPRRIFENEFYRQWGNGAPLSERNLPDWTDGSDLVEFLGERGGKKFDQIVLDEGADGGYGNAVKWRGESYIPLSPAQIKSVNNRGTFNPADPNIYRGLIPLMAAGGALAAMSPGSAQAAEAQAEWPKQAHDGRLIWPADMPGYRNTEPGLEAPLVDPVDIATAPIGMTTAAGRALAMAAEPGIAYGTDKALGALLGMFQRNTKTGGGGGI